MNRSISRSRLQRTSRIGCPGSGEAVSSAAGVFTGGLATTCCAFPEDRAMPKSDNANKLLHVPDSQTIAGFSVHACPLQDSLIRLDTSCQLDWPVDLNGGGQIEVFRPCALRRFVNR